jgi:hypothetical protein
MKNVRTTVPDPRRPAYLALALAGTPVDEAAVMAKTRKRQDGADASSPGIPDTAHEPRPVGTSGHDGGDHENYADRVALRAYELYLARGGSDGGDFDDWLTAERELSGPRSDDRRE